MKMKGKHVETPWQSRQCLVTRMHVGLHAHLLLLVCLPPERRVQTCNSVAHSKFVIRCRGNVHSQQGQDTHTTGFVAMSETSQLRYTCLILRGVSALGPQGHIQTHDKHGLR